MFSIQSNRDFLVLLNPLRRRHSLHLAECGEEGCLLEATLFAEGCHGELLVQSLRHKTLELLKAIGIDIVVIWFLDMKREDLAQLACRHSKGRGDVTHLQLLVEIRLCLAHILVHTEEETLHLLFVYSGLLIFRFLGHGLLLLHPFSMIYPRKINTFSTLRYVKTYTFSMISYEYNTQRAPSPPKTIVCQLFVFSCIRFTLI